MPPMADPRRAPRHRACQHAANVTSVPARVHDSRQSGVQRFSNRRDIMGQPRIGGARSDFAHSLNASIIVARTRCATGAA
jgi:hypothetical protein